MFDCFWLSVPVQLIAWKDSSPNVSSGTLNPTHSLTMFSRSELTVLTKNKQIDAAENIQRSSLYATTLGSDSFSHVTSALAPGRSTVYTV